MANNNCVSGVDMMVMSFKSASHYDEKLGHKNKFSGAR